MRRLEVHLLVSLFKASATGVLYSAVAFNESPITTGDAGACTSIESCMVVAIMAGPSLALLVLGEWWSRERKGQKPSFSFPDRSRLLPGARTYNLHSSSTC